MGCVQVAHNYARQDQLFHMVLHLPMALAAVSEAVQAILLQVRLPWQGSPCTCHTCLILGSVAPSNQKL